MTGVLPAPIPVIDARGLRCPLPVLKAEKGLEKLSVGESLILLADDPIAGVDIPVLCKRRGWILVCETLEDGARFTITKQAI